MIVAASAIGCRVTLNEGTTLRSCESKSGPPCCTNSSAAITSTGTSDSVTVRASARVPTTTSSCVTASIWRTTVICPVACSTSTSCGSKPGANTTTECGPGPRSHSMATPLSSTGTSFDPTETAAVGSWAEVGSRTRTSRHGDWAAACCTVRETAHAMEASARMRLTKMIGLCRTAILLLPADIDSRAYVLIVA